MTVNFRRCHLYALETEDKVGKIYRKTAREPGILLVISSNAANNHDKTQSASVLPRRTFGHTARSSELEPRCLTGVPTRRGDGGAKQDGEFECWQLLRAAGFGQEKPLGPKVGGVMANVEYLLAACLSAQLPKLLLRRLRSAGAPHDNVFPRGQLVQFSDPLANPHVGIVISNEELQAHHDVVAVVLVRDPEQADDISQIRFKVTEAHLADFVVDPCSVRSVDLNARPRSTTTRTRYGSAVLPREDIDRIVVQVLEYLGCSREVERK